MNQTLSETTTVATIGAMAAAFLSYRFYLGKTTSTSKEDTNETFIRLSKIEQDLLKIELSPISTITWFQGDHIKVAALIKDRLKTIIQANPWLGGRITKKSGAYHMAYVAETTTSRVEAAVNRAFTHMTPAESPLERGVPPLEAPLICSKHKITIPQGGDLKNPLLKVTVVPCKSSPSTTFSIVISMPHSIGDGHTFYQLYNMLMGTEQVHALNIERKESSTSQQDQVLGKYDQVFHRAGFILSMIKGLLYAKLIQPWMGKEYQTQTRFMYVDMDKISHLKKEQAVEDKVPFVSSNDVLTSWFLQNANDCHVGQMAINLRNRLEGHASNDAGNYENAIFYRKEDSARPALIRQSISDPTNLKRVVTASDVPSTLELATNNVAIITSWASFVAGDKVNIPSVTELLHMPLVDMFFPPSICLCLVFRARPKQLAIMLISTDDKVVNLINPDFKSEEEFR